MVYDMAGHEIYQFSDQNFTSGNRTYSYNVSRLNAGIYLVKFNLNGFVTEQKMVVVK